MYVCHNSAIRKKGGKWRRGKKENNFFISFFSHRSWTLQTKIACNASCDTFLILLLMYCRLQNCIAEGKREWIWRWWWKIWSVKLEALLCIDLGVVYFCIEGRISRGVMIPMLRLIHYYRKMKRNKHLSWIFIKKRSGCAERWDQYLWERKCIRYVA